MSSKSLRSVITSLVITESLKVYMFAIYPLHQFHRKETFFCFLLWTGLITWEARMVPQELLCTTASITKTLKHGFASHYYIKYSLALLKMVSNNCCIRTGVLFFFNIVIWERKKKHRKEDIFKKQSNIKIAESTNCHQSSY